MRCSWWDGEDAQKEKQEVINNSVNLDFCIYPSRPTISPTYASSTPVRPSNLRASSERPRRAAAPRDGTHTVHSPTFTADRPLAPNPPCKRRSPLARQPGASCGGETAGLEVSAAES